MYFFECMDRQSDQRMEVLPQIGHDVGVDSLLYVVLLGVG